MDCVKTEFDDLCITEDTNNASRMDKRKHIDAQDDDDDDQDRKYISKNLNAERRRRKKLSDRQLELRSLMNKATIITDAITYIEELQKSVEDLTDQLHQMEATSVAEENPNFKEIDAEQGMNKWGLAQPEVQVNHIGGTKYWIKIVFQKKRGGLTKLMEAISVLGFDITDTSITTSDGAVLVTLSAEGIHGGLSEADKIKKFLLEVIGNI
ncbi:UNVERIFIED_CONTAM: Transcription factor DYT1 [Sesamum indicum]